MDKKIILECLFNDDPDGIMNMIEGYLSTKNKVKACKDAKLSRITMYKAFQDKNPKLKTLCKLISCCK